MRVVHVAETVRGGIATYFNELYPLQRREMGEEAVHFVIPAEHRGDIPGVADRNITMFARTGRDLRSLARMAAATVGAVRRLSPDVVHLHSSFAGLMIRPLRRLIGRGTRIVYCPHGWSFARETSGLSRAATTFVERQLAVWCDRIVCISQSEHDLAVAAGLPADRLALVYSGLGTDTRPPNGDALHWPDDRVRVLYVGRLDRQKGFDLLIAAAAGLERAIDVRLIGSAVVGEEQRIALPPNVMSLGWQEPSVIEAQLRQADLVVIPSRWEGFGLVALEAMRAGKPIIASRAGALPELVEDGSTGILFDPGDVVGLASLLQGVDREALVHMGRRGHARFLERFTIERTHEGLMSVYHCVRGGEDEAEGLRPAAGMPYPPARGTRPVGYDTSAPRSSHARRSHALS